jgi:hypothetical protein
MAELAHTLALAPLTAGDVARGVNRLMLAEGLSPILEFCLPNNRRLDVAALGSDGTIAGIEIKISLADLRADDKCRIISLSAICSISRCRRIFPKARYRPIPASSWRIASAAPLFAPRKEKRCLPRAGAR